MITIVGLLPHQEQLVRRRFPEVRFRFLDCNRHQWDVRLSDGHIILRLKFIGHRMYSGLGHERVHRLYGGLSRLVELVGKLRGDYACLC